MTEILYQLVYKVAEIHENLLAMNDSEGYFLSDKQLHFVVMGVVGMFVFLLSYLIFKLLQDHIIVVAFIYAMTVMLVLTFAIEIGQGLTGTGVVEMADVQAGLAGFLLLFVVFAVIRAVILGIAHLLGFGRPREEEW
jgi:hypothetical protein